MENNIHFLSDRAHFFLERKMFQAKLVEKIKTHILRSITFSENRAIYEKMWKNIVERSRRHDNMEPAHFVPDT